MDKNALLYYQSACALTLSPIKTAQVGGFTIKLAKRNFFFRGGETPFNCGSSISIAENKYCMNKTLEAAGFPVPKANAFSKDEFRKEKLECLIEHLSFPLVVKPMLGTALGRDVLCNINSIEQLRAHMKSCYKRYKFLLIEEFHPNLTHYRVLVFYNKVIGVVERIPAAVVGDGIHSIKELIVIHNVEREKLKATVSLGPIKVDGEYLIRLNELNITLDTIPENNETITLCYTCNSTRGGTMISLGKQICKENAHLLCQAAKALNLNIVGFDVACEDICIPIAESHGVIIEANYNPDITIHESPMFGISNRVSKTILARLIFRHPISYILGLNQHRRARMYIKLSLLVFFIATFKLISV